MGYFAQINEDGYVTQVISISNEVLGEPDVAYPETEPIGVAFISETLQLWGEWRQTSFNNNFRGGFASIGYRYDHERDVFVPPSWILVDNVWTDPTTLIEPEIESVIDNG